MGITIDFNSLTDEQRKNDFYSFISAALVGRVDPIQSVDLEKLEVNLTLNGQEVDILRTWSMFTEFTGSASADTQAGEGEIIKKLLHLRQEMIDEAQRVDTRRREKLATVRDNITERVLEEVRYAVSESICYDHVNDTVEDKLTHSNVIEVERRFETLNALNNLINDLNGSIAS